MFSGISNMEVPSLKQLANLGIDFAAAFAAAYVAQLQAGDSATTSLWALLAAALVGAAGALNPLNSRYGIGASRAPTDSPTP